MVQHWIRKPKVIVFNPLLLALALAVACGAGATATPAPTATTAPAAPKAPAATTAPTATPTPTRAPATPSTAKVARLKVAMTPPAHQITLGWLSAISSGGPLSPMYEGLLDDNRFTGALEPMLATEWESSKDAMTVRVKLRKGVPFHTGKEFTAKDVVFTWERVTAEESVHSTVERWRAFFKSKNDFEIVNDHEIIYHLALPGVQLLPFISAGSLQSAYIYSKDQWEAIGGTTKVFAEKPTGTGPFRFKEFKEGQYILYEALEQHWRKVPEFKELQIFYVPEATTRLAQLLAKEVHITEIDRALKQEVLKKGMKVEVSTVPGIQVGIILGGNYLPDKRVEGPLSNRLVRQALNLAVNRQLIQQTIFAGEGEIQPIWSIHTKDEAFDPKWTVYPYDPVKAKDLMDKAGYPIGFGMELWTAKFPGAPEMPEVAEAVATMWKGIGVKVKIVETEFAGLRERYRTRAWTGTQGFTMRGGLQPGFRNIDGWFTSPGVGGGVVFAFEDPLLDEKWKRFARSLDFDERIQLLREMSDFVYQQYSVVPLLWLGALAGVDPDVVAEYKSNMFVFGPARHHEYTQAVQK